MKTINPHIAGHVAGDHLGARMLASRTHAGLSQKVAAARIGLTAGHLGRIERGGISMVKDGVTLQAAARVYGVSAVWLYAGAVAGAKLVPHWYGAPKMDLAA
jgi:transcriptional regulator with XRE-family HTH domain